MRAKDQEEGSSKKEVGMSHSPMQEAIDDVFVYGIKRFFRFEASGHDRRQLTVTALL